MYANGQGVKKDDAEALRWWRKAAERGLRCSINPDAHETDGLRHVAAGINVARKGGLKPKHIVNTLPLAEVAQALARRVGQRSEV